MIDPLQFLLERRSIPALQLGEPAPDAATLARLLEAALCVPDHGKLMPWRLLTVQGEALRQLGQRLAELGARNHPEWSEAKRDKEARRYQHAALVVAVVARIDPEARIPAREQLLSAGCVAHNLLLGAQALGFGAQWLTGWASQDRDAARLLGLDDMESIVAFVHIGTPQRILPARVRPPSNARISAWSP